MPVVEQGTTITGSVLHFSVTYARCPSHLSVYHRPRKDPQNVNLAQATQLSTTLNWLDLLTSWTEHVQGEEEQRQRAQRGCAHSPLKVEENDTTCRFCAPEYVTRTAHELNKMFALWCRSSNNQCCVTTIAISLRAGKTPPPCDLVSPLLHSRAIPSLRSVLKYAVVACMWRWRKNAPCAGVHRA